MDDYVSPEQLAEMHGVAANTIYLILRADQKLPESERRLAGAVKVGTKYRGEWRIPRQTAEEFRRDPRGRK